MIDATKLFYLIFGILTILGGLIGFVKAGSRASLIAGSLCGLTLLAAWGAIALYDRYIIGLIIGLVVSIALAGQFIPKVIGNRAAPHTILMAILSAASLVLTIVVLSISK